MKLKQCGGDNAAVKRTASRAPQSPPGADDGELTALNDGQPAQM